MRKSFKKILALTLSASMVFSLAACSKNGDTDSTTAANETTVAGGTETTTAAPVESNAVTYTYNYALSEFPTNWNYHTYQTNIDKEILNYISDGFYVFDYNDTLDGYKVIPSMAVAEPEDVTAEYVGRFGIEEGEANRAWKITLRDDLCWEDGTPIKAQDFVTSAELLLNPVAKNYRADSLYEGGLEIVGARAYLYGGTHAYDTSMIAEDYTAVEDLTEGENGGLYVGESDIVFNIYDGASWGSNGVADYYAAGYVDAFTKDGVDLYATVIEPAADEDGQVVVTTEVMEALMHFVANMHGAATVEEYAEAAGDYAYVEWEEFCYIGTDYEAVDFSTVGVVAESDTELVLVLANELSGFYLLYNLTGSWLVNEALYKACESVVDGVYTNSYCTSADTTISYGPYTLESYQADKQYVLQRNENYFGVKEGYYQTTTIQVDCVSEAATSLEMFLNGQLDSYGLTADDMETYQSSDYTYYTTTPSTYFIALNPDMDALTAAQNNLGAGYNKTIMTVKEFRQAMSYALDRTAFALAVSPTNNAAYSIFSDLIICDPDNGTAYRTVDEAKAVLAKFWGLEDEIGAGKMYETVDDAIESITGYNLALAKEKFDEAYDIAVAEGLMNEGDKVQILIGLPNSTANFYSKGYEFLVNCYTDAVKGTKLEGKLEFTMDDTLGNNFGNALRANQVDMLFGVGWSGSALDPYGLVGAYTTEQYRYNRCWDTASEMLTIELNGIEYTASVLDWTNAIDGQEITITAADGSTTTFKGGSADDVDAERIVILAALEGAILETFEMIPMLDASSASLKGMQVEFYTEDYIYGIGRGGLKYMTYNYSDAEWDEYVALQGGILNYK